jgi:hypothetical protein
MILSYPLHKRWVHDQVPERLDRGQVDSAERSVGLDQHRHLGVVTARLVRHPADMHDCVDSRIMFSTDYPYASMTEARTFLDRLRVSPAEKETNRSRQRRAAATTLISERRKRRWMQSPGERQAATPNLGRFASPRHAVISYR